MLQDANVPCVSLILTGEKEQSLYNWIQGFWTLCHGCDSYLENHTYPLPLSSSSCFQMGSPISQCTVIIRLYHFSFLGWDSTSSLPWPLLPLSLNAAGIWITHPEWVFPLLCLCASRNELLSPSSKPSPSMAWLNCQSQVAGVFHGAQKPQYLYGQINLANAVYTCIFISTLA